MLTFTLINASPLGFYRGICRADCKESATVKKMALFEHSELVVFREQTSVRKAVDSYRPRSCRERFLVSFFASKKGKREVNKVQISIKLSRLKKLWIPVFTGMTGGLT